MPSPLELVSDVAKLLEQGHLCYVDKFERVVHSFPIANKKEPEVVEQIRLLENKITKYIKVLPMPTEALIYCMKDFLPVMTDEDIKKELASGLNRKNPTRNFLQTLKNHPNIEQHWFIYKAEKYKEYVGQHFIDDYNY